MKFRIDKKNIMNLLVKTQNIAEKKTTMPSLINVLLKAGENKLKIFVTNLEVSLTDEVETEVQEDGKIAVNAKHLFEIVRELDDEGKIILEVASKGNVFPDRLHIEQGKSLFNIVYLDHSEYPVFPTLKIENFIELDKKIFMEMIDRTIYSVSNDETRYHLNGVFFENRKFDEKNYFRMVSTDGHRLSLVDKLTDVETLKLGVIVPRKGLIEIRKIIDFSNEPVLVAIEGSQFVLKTGNTVLMIRLIEGKYPDYKKLIPEDIVNEKEKSILFNRENLLNFIRRVSLLSDQKSNGINFTFSEGKMKMTSNNPELGDAKEEMDVEYSGDEIEIGFNAGYLMDILNSFSEEKFVFYFRDGFSPGVIQPEKDRDYTCVVMPIRL